MNKAVARYIIAALALGSAATFPRLASGQAPTSENQPRLAVPPRGEVIQPIARPAAPTPAAQPAAAAAVDTSSPALTPAPVGGAVSDPAAAAASPAAATPSTSTAAPTSYLAGNAMLALEGVQAGMLRNVEGGTARGDVVFDKGGSDAIPKKHLAGVKYHDISFDAPITLKPVTDWIAAAWKGSFTRKDGSLTGLSPSGTIQVAREFHQATISATTIPTLEVLARSPAYLTVVIAPEYTQLKPGSGGVPLGSSSHPNWMTSGFRFEMAGLDGTHVSRIDSFTVQQVGPEATVGEQRSTQAGPSKVVFPNLKITMTESTAPTWAAWHDDFVVKGNNGEDKEKDGAIVLLGTTMNELGRIKLFNCGIVDLTSEFTEQARLQHGAGQASNPSLLRRLTAELYCERMELVAN